MDPCNPTTSAKPTQARSTRQTPKQEKGNPCIPVSRETVQICGGHLGAAIVLTQLLFWAKSRSPEEWFFQSMQNLCAQLGFNRQRVYRARERLVNLGFISQQFFGIPRRVKLVIHHDQVAAAKELLSGVQLPLFAPPEVPRPSVDMSAFYPASHVTLCPNVGDTLSHIMGHSVPMYGTQCPNIKEEIPSRDPVIEIPQESKACSEPEKRSVPPSSDPPVLVFPVLGKEHQWQLSKTKLLEYEETYPDMNVLSECRKARQWCIDNRAKRKTAVGMPRFLGSWLGKAQNHGDSRRNGLAPPPIVSRFETQAERTVRKVQEHLMSLKEPRYERTANQAY